MMRNCILLCLLGAGTLWADEPGPGYVLIERITHDFALTEAARDLVIEIYDAEPGIEAPLHKLILSSVKSPESKSLLLAYDRGAEALLSPHGTWIVVNDRPHRGSCSPRLFRQEAGTDVAEDQSQNVRQAAVQLLAETLELSPAIHTELLEECYVEAQRWAADSNSLLVRVSHTYSAASVQIDDWLCVYDLESGTCSLDLAKLNQGAAYFRPIADDGLPLATNPWFPFEPGNYLVYEGTVTTMEPAWNEPVHRSLRWRTRVAEVMEVPGYQVALVEGMPHHAAFFDETAAAGWDLLIVDDQNHLYLSSLPDARLAFWRTQSNPTELPERFARPRDLIGKADMKVGEALATTDGETEVRPGRHNFGVEAIDASLNSVPEALREAGAGSEYQLAYRTSSGVTERTFVPGLGITREHYHHNGTPGNYDLRIVEIGRDADHQLPAGIVELGDPEFEDGVVRPGSSFVHRYLSLSQSNGGLEEVGDRFHEEITYFGSAKTRDALLEEEAAYRIQWPFRSMKVVGDVEARALPDEAVRLAYTMAFTTASLERKERSTGTLKMEMVVKAGEDGKWRISSLNTVGVPQPDPFTAVMGQSIGPVNHNSTLESLTLAVGAENITTATIFNEFEGKTETISQVYADTPKHLRVFWEEDRPARVSFSHPESPWRSPAGLGIGTSLSEVEQLNGGPFTLYGFEWDYGGMMGSWLGGALARDHAIGHFFRAGFHYPDDFDQAALEQVMGDALIRSDEAPLRQLSPFIAGMEFYFPLDPILAMHIGGIYRGLEDYHLEGHFPIRPEKTAEELWAADGLYHQGWHYPGTGLSLGMAAEVAQGAQTVEGITITAPCPLLTERGIGIGSTRAEVALAYADWFAPEDSEPGSTFVAGSVFDGIIFRFEDDKVVEISLGSAAE